MFQTGVFKVFDDVPKTLLEGSITAPIVYLKVQSVFDKKYFLQLYNKPISGRNVHVVVSNLEQLEMF